MLQNMYFEWEIFAWSHLYFCVNDFRKVESTLFHNSSTFIVVGSLKKNGVTRIAPRQNNSRRTCYAIEKKHKSDFS